MYDWANSAYVLTVSAGLLGPYLLNVVIPKSGIVLFGTTFGASSLFPLAVGVSGLEIIVVLVQAYVFTLLSAVFIGMAIHAHH